MIVISLLRVYFYISIGRFIVNLFQLFVSFELGFSLILEEMVKSWILTVKLSFKLFVRIVEEYAGEEVVD